jgi:hypothetical protein
VKPEVIGLVRMDQEVGMKSFHPLFFYAAVKDILLTKKTFLTKGSAFDMRAYVYS